MKKTKLMNLLVVGLVLVAGAPAFAEGEGGSSPGGGDPCEDRIKIIKADIQSWVNKGGPEALNLFGKMSTAQYSQAILTAAANSHVQCVSQGDREYPVMVFGVAKTCKYETNKSLITCDLAKFNSLSEPEQYRLVHHELAGLAQIEQPNKADSNYHISNQITAFLQNEVVKRLAVKSVVQQPRTGVSLLYVNGSTMVLQSDILVPGSADLFTIDGYTKVNGKDVRCAIRFLSKTLENRIVRKGYKFEITNGLDTFKFRAQNKNDQVNHGWLYCSGAYSSELTTGDIEAALSGLVKITPNTTYLEYK